ncbi:MAG: YkgJ family cysteine cluster protein [Desulfobacteraceae bacterium]|nr:YkgJ family cysteine cluster protein [Desulfobacteraceae bacterium]
MIPSKTDAPSAGEPRLEPIGIHQRFRFSCHPGVPCFNLCCRDLNQFLYPYDILRLRRRLGLTSGEFLSAYTRQHVGPETGLPVVSLRPASSDHRECPFVTEAGCAVYEDRPASCRTYPLARAVSRNRETGRVTEHWAVLREPHCRGFETDNAQTVAEFISDQETAVYNRYNDLLLDILRLKNQKMPGPLPLRERHIFHLALYDLDAFRQKATDAATLRDLHLPPERIERLQTEDIALLEVAHRWVGRVLFGKEPVLGIGGADGVD